MESKKTYMSEFMSNIKPGLVVLFGSGETSASGGKVFDRIVRDLYQPPTIALLETPAGFELNSERVIGRVADFLEQRLQNYQPDLVTIRARKLGTPDSPDNPDVLAPLLGADLIFMGPGSPTYAVRQLRSSLAWHMLLACHYLGVGMVLASAAVIAFSAYALPVYEIYKVGEDLHWKEGLDFFGLYHFPLVLVPHWNNRDGGKELDTTCCFMGRERFASLVRLLPPGITVLGIDEKTALFLDMQHGTCHVVGLGGVTIIHTGHAHAASDMGQQAASWRFLEDSGRQESHIHVHLHGETFPLSDCCPVVFPEPGKGVTEEVWKQVVNARQQLRQKRIAPVDVTIPAAAWALVIERETARQNKDWQKADDLRKKLADLGWQVQDRPEGPIVRLIL